MKWNSLCLAMVISACGTQQGPVSAGKSSAVYTAEEEPGPGVLAGLKERWNRAATEFLPVPNVQQELQYCFIWEQEEFVIPTYCGGSDEAYHTFDQIKNSFFNDASNVEYLEENNLMDYLVKSYLGTSVTFRQLSEQT